MPQHEVGGRVQHSPFPLLPPEHLLHWVFQTSEATKMVIAWRLQSEKRHEIGHLQRQSAS